MPLIEKVLKTFHIEIWKILKILKTSYLQILSHNH